VSRLAVTVTTLSNDSVVFDVATDALLSEETNVALAAAVEDVPGTVPKTFSAFAVSKQPTSTPSISDMGIAKHRMLGPSHDSSLKDLLEASHLARRMLIHATCPSVQASPLANCAYASLRAIAFCRLTLYTSGEMVPVAVGIVVIAVGTSDLALPVLIVRLVEMAVAEIEVLSEVGGSELAEPGRLAGLVELLAVVPLVEVLELGNSVREVDAVRLDEVDDEMEPRGVPVVLELPDEVKSKVADIAVELLVVMKEPKLPVELVLDDVGAASVGTTKVTTVVPSVLDSCVL